MQAFLLQHARVQESDYRDDGIFMKVNCDPAVAKRAEKMLLEG